MQCAPRSPRVTQCASLAQVPPGCHDKRVWARTAREHSMGRHSTHNNARTVALSARCAQQTVGDAERDGAIVDVRRPDRDAQCEAAGGCLGSSEDSESGCAPLETHECRRQVEYTRMTTPWPRDGVARRGEAHGDAGGLGCPDGGVAEGICRSELVNERQLQRQGIEWVEGPRRCGRVQRAAGSDDGACTERGGARRCVGACAWSGHGGRATREGRVNRRREGRRGGRG